MSAFPCLPVVILAGPTGVGKSLLAMAMAARTPSEIIVADSMQVYRGMDVGTGKPSAADRRAVPHHLVDLCDPTQDFSAFEFARRAHEAVESIRARGRLPILVGGTGLYLRAFLKGQLAGTGRDPALRARLRAEADAGGAAVLHGRLKRMDPVSASRIRPGDLFRIVRAIELCELTGGPASAIRPDLWDPPRIEVAAFVVLMREREELCRLIDLRAKRMWEEGLLDEVRGLLRAGYSADLRPLQSLGYRQAVKVLMGKDSEAVGLAEMQRATRRYAKRQVTWFRREPAAEFIAVRGDAWAAPLAAMLLGRLEEASTRTGCRAATGRRSAAEGAR